MKRTKVKLKQPNPLFEKWLQEWKNEAAAKGSDMQYCFGKALTSLRKYPLPLNSGRDCGILQNFGNRLCVMLDRKLAEFKKQYPEGTSTALKCSAKDDSPNLLNSVQLGNNLPQTSPKPKKRSNCNKIQQSSSERNMKRKSSEYIPSYRSGSYAILLGLLEAKSKEGYTGFIEKGELQKLAQPLCDSSFTKPEPGSYYTAWSSMSTLVKKGLVSSVGRCKYSLTVEGENVAKKLENVKMYDADSGLSGITHKSCVVNHAVPSCSNTKRLREVPPVTVSPIENQKRDICEKNTIILAPWTFDVILLLDTQESSGVAGRKGKCDSPLNDLNKQNVVSEVRHLKIGDFAWICRERNTRHEVVLPYIIERKRVDDFAKSIIDGRFREQKFRLKQCGIPNLIYLVEKHGKESHTALPLETLNQAAANTEVADGFTVKYTSNHRESATYLANLTHFLCHLFMGKTLVTCSKKDIPQFSVNHDVISLMSFQEFNCSSMKNKTLIVQDMFVKHLVQLNGLSVEKALAIVERYPTPYSLYTALKNGDVKLLSEIPFGSSRRRIGPVLSKSVYELFSNSILS